MVLLLLPPCVQVVSRFGPKPLSQCFVLSKSIHSDEQELLSQLQLPILDLPLPPSSSLAFLEKLGVSTDLNLQTLLKILQQLSAAGQLAGSGSHLTAMQRLYQLVYAQVLQGSKAAAAVRSSFGQLPLLFVPVMQQQALEDGSSAGLGYWVTCKDVLWSGSKRIFPHKIFIAHLYEVGQRMAGHIPAGYPPKRSSDTFINTDAWWLQPSRVFFAVHV
jgi:hypothetical protein